MTTHIIYLPFRKESGRAADIVPAQIRFDAVEADQWRVVDIREPVDSGRHVIGFVRRIAGVFEVTILGAEDNNPAFCTSLDAARACFPD